MRTLIKVVDNYLERGNFQLRLLSVLFALCLVFFGALFTFAYLAAEPNPSVLFPIASTLGTSVGLIGPHAIFAYRASRDR